MRAQAVANEFGFQWDSVPLEPLVEEIYDESVSKDTVSGVNIPIKVINSTFIIVLLASLILG